MWARRNQKNANLSEISKYLNKLLSWEKIFVTFEIFFFN